MKKHSHPKHQHWVPRFYLKYFATSDTRNSANPKVFVVDKKGNFAEPRLTLTKKICGQNYLNSPKDEHGKRDFSFEDFLGKMENSTAEYWTELDSGHFNLEDGTNRQKLSEFLAALHLRNKFIADLEANLMKTRDALFGGPKSTSASGRTADIEPHQRNPDPTDPTRYFVQSTRAAIPKIAKTFSSYDWTVLSCDEDILSTSDRPVTFISSTSLHSGPGSTDPAAIFPISPRKVLYMERANGNPTTNHRKVDLELLKRMNRLIYIFAPRLSIMGDRPPDYLLGK